MSFTVVNTGGNWTDGYMQASFRGKKFFVESDTVSGGRILNEHQFIDTDDSYDEDSGSKKKIINIEAYLIGDDYFNQRNELIEALDKKGEGALIHPYYGELTVKVDSYSVDHTIKDGRMCTVSIVFKVVKVEALMIVPDSAYTKLTDAKSLLQTILQALATAYDFASKPVKLMDDMLNVLDQCIDIMEAAKGITGLVDEFQAKLDAFKGKALNISFMAEAIWSDIQELVDFGADINNPEMEVYWSGELGKDHFNDLKSVSGIQNQTLTSIPGVGNIDGAPAKELQKYISRQALASRTGLIATMEIKNKNEAETIAKELDTELRLIENEEGIDDDLFTAAQDLRVAIRAMIEERKLSLNELTKIELDEFEPGLKLAYNLYKEAERDSEIAELNEILHPGFIQGKRELLVNSK